MKKYSFTLVIMLIFSGFAFAQDTYELKKVMDLYRVNEMATGLNKNFLTENDIEGSPYLNNDFINGSIYTTSKTQYADVPLRYNIYSDDIEFKTEDGKVMSLASPDVVEKVVFGDYKMVYIPYSYVKKVNRGFFIVLQEGKATLLARPGVTFNKATEPGAYQEAKPANFQRKLDTYFIRVGQEFAKPIDNKKNLVEAFSDNQDKIEAFMKKNKTKINNADSLKKLFEYYNSL